MHTTKRPNAFALIVTLIMVVLAVTIVLALLSNASLDRISASATSQRTRAEMAAQSGLAGALNALVGAGGPTDFRFVTAAGNDGKPVMVPLTYDSASGVTTADATKQRPLYSQGGSTATITLSSTTSPKTTRDAGYVSMTAKINGNDQEVQRYAFYVDEGGSRQNVGVQGGKDRIYARDPNEVPLMTTAAPPAPLSDVQMTAVSTARPALFTAASLNPLLTVSSAPLTPAADDYNFATASAISNLAPNNKPRVNLTKLKAYIDSNVASVDQAKNNDKSKLVDRLLNSSEEGVDWGPGDGKPGGNLSFLTQTGHYNTQQCHQIVANLIDYLDSDMVPTTDDIDNPTYFGVEGQENASGQVVGHPYVNFVGTGLIFNRSGAAGNIGGLNSTRIVMVLGLVNPWTAQTKDWDAFYIEPEAEIVVSGDASGGTLGNNASDYFEKTFTSKSFDPSPTGNPEKTYPIKNIPPNKAYSFPVPMSGITNYSIYKELKGTGKNGLGQPPGMVFTNLGFKINKLRIKYTSNDVGGGSGYIQVLDHLTSSQPQPAVPSTVDVDHSNSPSALIYKFAGSTLAPGATDKADYHLNSDPRLSFLTPGSVLQNWMLSKSSESLNPAPPKPLTAVAIFTGSDNNNSDFAGSQPKVSDHTWYTSTDITSDFFVKSPSSDGSNPTVRVDTAGEMGFIHTGIPWETLRLYVTGNEANGKQRDKEILSYVHSGTFNTVDYGTVPAHVGQSAPTTAIPLMGGPLNLNTNKEPTLQGLFRGATAVADSDATSRAKGGSDDDSKTLSDAIVANAGVSLLALPSDFLALPNVKSLTNAKTKDFDREIVARRVANMIGTQSTRFTVYALGEARDKAGTTFKTTSSVNLKAEVEIQADSSGKPMPKVLSSVYYLTN